MAKRSSLLLGAVMLIGLSGCGKKDAPAGGDPGVAASSVPQAAVKEAVAFLSSFEGEIGLSMTDHDANHPKNMAMSVFVKNGKVRFDVPEDLGQRTPLGPGAYVILDAAAKKLDIVSDAQKQVFVIDLNTSGEALKGLGGQHRHGPPSPAPQEEPKVTVTKTGKMETVADRKCEDWDVMKDHREATVCVANEDTSWFHIPLTGLPTEQAWAAELLDGKHFPLRVVSYDKDGATEKSRFEVTKIDKKSLPDTQFEYPPTYAVSDFGQMFAHMGMGGYPGGMPGHMPPGMAGGMPPGMPPGMMGPHPHHVGHDPATP